MKPDNDMRPNKYGDRYVDAQIRMARSRRFGAIYAATVWAVVISSPVLGYFNAIGHRWFQLTINFVNMGICSVCLYLYYTTLRRYWDRQRKAAERQKLDAVERRT